MIEVGYSSSFKKAFKKLLKAQPEIEEKFWAKIDLLFENPFNAKLRTHKLSGRLSGIWSFSVDFSVRVLFYFESDSKLILVDIGSHEEVY